MSIYIDYAAHAIGLDRKKPYKRHRKLFYRPYRNYYAASVKYCEVWEMMVNSGYAKADEKKQNWRKNVLANLIGLEKSLE